MRDVRVRAGGAASTFLVLLTSITAVLALAPAPSGAITAPIVTAGLKQVIATSSFSPASPDPAGIVYLPDTDRLEIVDSEVDETTGAGYQGVNLWQLTLGGNVTATGSTWTGGANFSAEPTGLGHDALTDTHYVSDDSTHRIWSVRAGADGVVGSADDELTYVNAGAYGSGDTEDPEFDPITGHLFFIDGTNLEVYNVDPVNAVFGDGDDLMTHFDVAKDGLLDIEGLSSDPTRGTLLVGDRVKRQIFEYTKGGTLLRIIDASQIAGMRYLSGLALGPASDNASETSLWVVDRGVDNDAAPSENDGKIFELSIPAASTGTTPTALGDSAITAANATVVVNVVANDSDPDGDLDLSSLSIASAPPSGTATPNVDGTVSFAPAPGIEGRVSFGYQVCDATLRCASATATIVVGGVTRYDVSLADNVTIAGISGTVKDEDLVSYNVATRAWSMYFDASDVGITVSDIRDFSVRANGSILMSFSDAISVPGLTGGPAGTAIDDSDIILFTPITTGPTTSGSFSFYLDGSDIGLSESAEELDAIHEFSNGTLALSTSGSASVPGLAGADEDVLLFVPTSTGAVTAGTWTAQYFDGSDIGLTAGDDDLDAISFDTTGDLLYSTLGPNTRPRSQDEDINRFTGTFGSKTSGTAMLDVAVAALAISATNDVDGLHTRR